MQSEITAPGGFPTWDLYVDGTIVPFITGDAGDAQGAGVTAYLQLGTIPQLPTIGVPWTEFLTGEVGFGVVDASIRKTLVYAGITNYYPNYDIVNDNVIVKMEKQT